MKVENKTIKELRLNLNNEDEIRIEEEFTGIVVYEGRLGRLPFAYDDRYVKYSKGKEPVVLIVKVRK